MITREKLKSLKKWFDNYVKEFNSDDIGISQNIDLKIKHIKNVCSETLEISSTLDLNDENRNIAETTALLHDIGRFEQFTKYKTFADNRSENHSLLGIKIIEKYSLLDDIDIKTKNLIFNAIKNHNQKSISDTVNEETMLFSRIIRDADKLDNFRVILEYYDAEKKDKKNSSVTLDLPEGTELTKEIYEKLLIGETLNYEDLKTSLDFKLIYLSWIYDINFQHSFKKIKEKKYLESIYNELPHDEKIDILFNKIKHFIEKKVFSEIL